MNDSRLRGKNKINFEKKHGQRGRYPRKTLLNTQRKL